MPWLFTLIVAPILFFLLTWILVTAVRILRADRTVRLERASTFVHRRTGARKVMAVAVKSESDTREAYERDESYMLADGWSSGIPNSWHSELWIRRN
ncbi:MAG: hypothetical protein HKN43_09605 [Rhodothermales bacterium]|nr:hypothetical protein [Rhodothermales bacterium]